MTDEQTSNGTGTLSVAERYAQFAEENAAWDRKVKQALAQLGETVADEEPDGDSAGLDR